MLLLLVIMFKRFPINYNIPKPHLFVNKTLHSDLSVLLEIVAELEKLLPQLSSFIDQFNNTALESDVNVITDREGNMDIDVPARMSDEEAQAISKKLGIIDRLITTQGQKVNDLLQRGMAIENDLRAMNPNHVSYLEAKIAEFRALNESFKH
jgi:hypothetical protein